MARLTTCPDCHTEISVKAKACPRCGRPNKPNGRYGIGSVILGSIVAFFVVASLMRKPGDGPAGAPAIIPAAPPAPPVADQPGTGVTPTTRPRAGSAGVISRPGLDGTWAATDEAQFDLMSKAMTAKNTDLLMSMIREGKVAQIPNGTKVHVLESPFSMTKFRVAGGEMTGFEGWTAMEYVLPAN